MRRAWLLHLFLKAACSLRGEAFNGLLRQYVFKDVDVDKNAIAIATGALLGLFDGQKVPRKIECVDLVKALGIEKDYDEQRVYGKLDVKALDVRESEVVLKLEELFGPAHQALHKFILNFIKDYKKILQLAEEHYSTDPRLESYEITIEDETITIKLCYKRPEISKALLKSKYGGIVSGLVANALARAHGFEGARFERVEAVGENCVAFHFRPIKRFLSTQNFA